MSADIISLNHRRQLTEAHSRMLYEVSIFNNATHITDPNHDEIDRADAATAMLDATFRVHRDTDECILLVMIGAERLDSVRLNETYTDEQKRWLARRLDDLYQQVTGEPRKWSFFGRRK